MIKSNHDILVALPPGAFSSPRKGLGWINSFRRFSGFGRTVRRDVTVTDVNKDGLTILQVSCPRGVEAIVRRANGEIVTKVDALSYAKDVKLDIAGDLTVTFREVRNG
jgi:hypothetical protein